jgi:hypothetical protein
MPASISWTLKVQVVDGPQLSLSDGAVYDAYDVVDVVIPDGPSTSTTEVEVQPSTTTGRVQFLLITSDRYGANLTYKVDKPSAPKFTLDAPVWLVGKGGVGLLGNAPKTLLFTNTLGQPASVKILVGRDAAP